MVRVCKVETQYTNQPHKASFFSSEGSIHAARQEILLSFVKPKFITVFGRTRHLYLSSQVFKINLVYISLPPIRATCHAYAIFLCSSS